MQLERSRVERKIATVEGKEGLGKFRRMHSRVTRIFAVLMTDLLWSDPSPLPGLTPSKRGVACQFGPDITEAFLKNNNLGFVIRSHEMKEEGYEVEHGGKLVRSQFLSFFLSDG